MDHVVNRRVAWALIACAALLVTLAGCKSGAASSAASSAAANPTVSADAAAAKAKAQAAVDKCGSQLGGTPAPGFSVLAQPAVLHHLATHAGRQAFLQCVTPDPAKQQAAEHCIGQAMTVFVLHPGALAGQSSGSVDRRHGAEQQVFTCVETATS
jgi:hypothetical protein